MSWVIGTEREAACLHAGSEATWSQLRDRGTARRIARFLIDDVKAR